MPYRARAVESAPRGARRSFARAAGAIVVIGTTAALGAAVAWAWRSTARRPIPPRELRAMAPLTCASTVAEYGEGGLRNVYCGPLRGAVSVLDDHAEIAAERFASDIVGAVRTADGWIFVAADGTVAGSETFLGRLRHLGRVSCLRAPRASRGRAALIDAVGALWTTDGHSPMRRAVLPSRVFAAAFRDADRGAALLERGAIVATDDGGETWHPVDLGAEVGWDVEFEPAGLAVTTTGGRQYLSAEGTFLGASCRTPSPLFVRREIFPDYLSVGRYGARTREVFGGPMGATRCTGDALAGAGLAVDLAPRVGGATRFTCAPGRRIAAPDRPAPPPQRPALGVRRHAEVVRAVTDSDLVRGEFGSSLSLSWRIWESGRFHTGATGPATRGALEVARNYEDPNQDVGIIEAAVEAVSARGVLIQPSFDSWLNWGRAGGAVVQLRQPSVACLGVLDSPTTAVLLDGGVAYLLDGSLVPGVAAASALEVAPEGRVRVRRGVNLGDDELVTLARWGSSTGVVVRSRNRATAWRFLPLDRSPERGVPAIPSAALRACEALRRPDDPGVLTLWFDALDLSLGPVLVGPSGDPLRLFSEIERSDQGVCLRSVRTRCDRLGDVALEAQPGNRLEGVADAIGEDFAGDGVVRAIACEAE